MPESAAAEPAWGRIGDVLLADPGGRGVARLAQGLPGPLPQLVEAAVGELSAGAARVVIVTGFCILGPQPPAAETDGPPGALRLAQTLSVLGREVTLLTDRLAAPLLEAGLQHLGLTAVRLECLPTRLPRAPAGTPGAQAAITADDDWLRAFLGRVAPTHLIAIERAGPSHTAASFLAQPRRGPPPQAEFQRLLPPDARDVCHNMRGLSIESWTAPLHRLFELAPRSVRTLGIGDGGNEIGCGGLLWESIAAAVPGGTGGRIACRIATDRLLLAGTSNFAAYGLAAALLAVAGRSPFELAWDPLAEQKLLDALVAAGGVDGVGQSPRPTVDGLAAPLYAETLERLLRACAGQ